MSVGARKPSAVRATPIKPRLPATKASMITDVTAAAEASTMAS